MRKYSLSWKSNITKLLKIHRRGEAEACVLDYLVARSQRDESSVSAMTFQLDDNETTILKYC